MTIGEVKELLTRLLEARGVRADAAALSLQVLKGRFEPGKNETYWRNGAADQDPEGERKPAYLATYFRASEMGERFFTTGIRVGVDGKRLVPDRAVIRTYLEFDHLLIEADRFVFTPKGRELVERVLAEAGL